MMEKRSTNQLDEEVRKLLESGHKAIKGAKSNPTLELLRKVDAERRLFKNKLDENPEMRKTEFLLAIIREQQESKQQMHLELLQTFLSREKNRNFQLLEIVASQQYEIEELRGKLENFIIGRSSLKEIEETKNEDQKKALANYLEADFNQITERRKEEKKEISKKVKPSAKPTTTKNKHSEIKKTPEKKTPRPVANQLVQGRSKTVPKHRISPEKVSEQNFHDAPADMVPDLSKIEKKSEYEEKDEDGFNKEMSFKDIPIRQHNDFGNMQKHSFAQNSVEMEDLIQQLNSNELQVESPPESDPTLTFDDKAVSVHEQYQTLPSTKLGTIPEKPSGSDSKVLKNYLSPYKFKNYSKLSAKKDVKDSRNKKVNHCETIPNSSKASTFEQKKHIPQ